jgi:signal transduction histidine kinase
MQIIKHILPIKNYWLLPGMFLIVLVILFSLLIYHNYRQQNRLTHEKYEYLSAISDLKVDKIQNWVKERKGEARFTYSNESFIEIINELLENPENTETVNYAAEWLRPMKESHDYIFITFLSTDGTQILPTDGVKIGQDQKNAALAAGKSEKITISGIIQDFRGNIFMDMFVPLIDNDYNRLLGTVIFRIDPRTELFPLIKNITIPSRSLETLLVKREKDGVLILNELRNDPEITPMSLKLAGTLENEHLLEFSDREGTITGIDYRNIEVLADIKRVQDFDWIIITKIDIDEIFEPLVAQRNQFTIMILLVSAFLALLVFFLIKNRQNKYFRDIVAERNESEKKIRELNNQLITARDVSEESSKLKSAILMNMSHEIRTPLNGILGFAQLLSRKLNGTAEEDMIGHIMVSGDRLLKTLTNIMDLAQLESEKARVRTKQYFLKDIVGDLCEKYELLAGKKKLSFKKCIDVDYPLRADRKMLAQVLGHILDNAIKYTENGGVSISADQCLVNGILCTRIHISDTGIGIPSGETENIFLEFRQLSQGYKRQYEGSGIGLSLVKKMISLMNGTISVDSNPGKGSVFTISLPAGIPASVKEQKEKSAGESPAGKLKTTNTVKTLKPNILIVEDNKVNAELIAAYLEDNVSTEYAADGETALKMAENKIFDIILMDINLGPGIDGLETMDRMRNINGYNNTPVVAVTGYTMEEDKKRFLKRGCDYFLAKPFTQKELRLLIKQINGFT